MGPMLNPRIGAFDIKFFFELRPGIMHWFFTTVALCLKQHETYGTVSTPMMLVCFYHLCFVNACYKGEQCVPFTIDIIYEKFGWMLLMLDIVMVPFIFPLQAYYIYKMGPYEHSVPYTVLVASMHIFGYWLFDTANSQKDYFREQEKEKLAKENGTVPEPVIGKGFPRLPWDRLHNPQYIETKRGTKLLVSGWWKYARHMNYTGDLLMSWSWGLTCGLSSYFPFAYTTYLTPLLLHRERRDDRDCREKYGAQWDEYVRRVPYRLFPWIY
jgi:delta24(24(1))-sterol reductase